MRICFDLDETLCTGYPYKDAKPIPGSVELLTELKELGHTIIIQTARGMGRCAGNQGLAIACVGSLTFSQLKEWGFKYDEIYFGKPAADLYVDDKSINPMGIELSSIHEVVRSIELAKSASELEDRFTSYLRILEPLQVAASG